MQVDDFLRERPESTLAALHWRLPPGDDAAAAASVPPTAQAFILQTNSSPAFYAGRFQNPTTHIQLPLQVASC